MEMNKKMTPGQDAYDESKVFKNMEIIEVVKSFLIERGIDFKVFITDLQPILQQYAL